MLQRFGKTFVWQYVQLTESDDAAEGLKITHQRGDFVLKSRESFGDARLSCSSLLTPLPDVDRCPFDDLECGLGGEVFGVPRQRLDLCPCSSVFTREQLCRDAGPARAASRSQCRAPRFKVELEDVRPETFQCVRESGQQLRHGPPLGHRLRSSKANFVDSRKGQPRGSQAIGRGRGP